MTTLSKLSFQDEGLGLCKRNKCHAQESMMKKRVLDTWRSKVYIKKERKRVGHIKVQVFKKQREKDSPCPKKEREKDSSWKESTHHPYNNIQTHAHLDQGLWLISPLDLVFDFATYEQQVCLQLSPYPELHIKAFLEVGEKKATLCLGEETKKQKERSERTNWGVRLCLILKIHKTQVSQ